MFGHVDMDQPGCCQLPENTLPAMFIEIVADAKGWQFVVLPLLDFVS
jgi:hypothetical protein